MAQVKITKKAAKPIAIAIYDYAIFCAGYHGWDEIAALGVTNIQTEVISEGLSSKSKAMVHFRARAAALTPPKAPKVLSSETGRPVKTMMLGGREIEVEVASDIDRARRRGSATGLTGVELRKAVQANLKELSQPGVIGVDNSLGILSSGAMDL